MLWKCCTQYASKFGNLSSGHRTGKGQFSFQSQRSEVKWSEVAQSCPTLCDPMDCSPAGSLVYGIFQAWILEWVAISFSRGSSRPRDWIRVSRIVGRRFTVWATREAPNAEESRLVHRTFYFLKLFCQDNLPVKDLQSQEVWIFFTFLIYMYS